VISDGVLISVWQNAAFREGHILLLFSAVFGMVALVQLSYHVCFTNAQVQNKSKGNCTGTRTFGWPQEEENA